MADVTKLVPTDYTAAQDFYDDIDDVVLLYADNNTLDFTDTSSGGALAFNESLVTGTVKITCSGGSGNRYSEQSGWDADMTTASLGGARLGAVTCSAGNTVIVEFLGLTASAVVSTSTSNDVTFRACLFDRQVIHSAGAGSVMYVYSSLGIASAFWGTEDQWLNHSGNGESFFENCLSVGHDGFEYRAQVASKVKVNNCVGFEIMGLPSYTAVFSGTFVTGSANNVSSDSSAPGTSPDTNRDYASWMEAFGEHNLNARITTDRKLDDDCLECVNFESNDLHGINDFVSDSSTQLAVSASAALHSASSYGLRLNITAGGTNAIRQFQFGDQTDATLEFLFEVDTGSIDDGDEFIFARGDTNGGSLVIRFVIRNSGGQYAVRLDSNLALGSWVNVSVGTIYTIRCRRNSVASGLALNEIAEKADTPSFTASLNDSDDYSGAKLGSWGPYYTSGQSGDAGTILDFDVASVHTPDVPAAPDSTTPPMGDDNTGNEIGSDPAWLFDNEGTARPASYCTKGPFQIDSAPAGGGQPAMRRYRRSARPVEIGRAGVEVH